jgi:Zn-dependent protease
MIPFQAPAPTRFDLNFSIFNFEVRVHPLFWVIMLFLVGLRGGLLNAVIWIAAVFVSILLHELGHALMMRYFGQDSYIVLYGFGGLAVPIRSVWGGSAGLTPVQWILVFLAGPFAGFGMAALVVAIGVLIGGSLNMGFLLFVIPFPSLTLPFSGLLGGIAQSLVGSLLWINIFWGLINLLPVYPLDGGQVSMHALTLMDPVEGQRRAFWLSVITGGLLAVVGLLVLQSIFMGVMFGMLAFQSYQMVSGGTVRFF